LNPPTIEKTLGSKTELVVPGLVSARAAALGEPSTRDRICLTFPQECS
jgi:hypothetical protein